MVYVLLAITWLALGAFWIAMLIDTGRQPKNALGQSGPLKNVHPVSPPYRRLDRSRVLLSGHSEDPFVSSLAKTPMHSGLA